LSRAAVIELLGPDDVEIVREAGTAGIDRQMRERTLLRDVMVGRPVRVLPLAGEGFGRQALPAVGGAEGGKVFRLPSEPARAGPPKRREERTIREDDRLSWVDGPAGAVGRLRKLEGAAAIRGDDEVRRADVARAVQAAPIAPHGGSPPKADL